MISDEQIDLWMDVEGLCRVPGPRVEPELYALFRDVLARVSEDPAAPDRVEMAAAAAIVNELWTVRHFDDAVAADLTAPVVTGGGPLERRRTQAAYSFERGKLVETSGRTIERHLSILQKLRDHRAVVEVGGARVLRLPPQGQARKTKLKAVE